MQSICSTDSRQRIFFVPVPRNQSNGRVRKLGDVVQNPPHAVAAEIGEIPKVPPECEMPSGCDSCAAKAEAKAVLCAHSLCRIHYVQKL